MLKLKLQQFGAPGGTTALRADTFNNLQLNAGILLKNVDYSGITDSASLKAAIANIISGGANPIGTLVGATRGGGTFNVTRDLRTPDIDGMRYGFKGSDFVDSTDASGVACFHVPPGIYEASSTDQSNWLPLPPTVGHFVSNRK